MPPAPLQPTIFYLHRFGDMVMLTSLVHFLRRRYGGGCHVVGTGDWTPIVYHGNPHVAQVWAFHRHAPFVLSPNWWRLARALRDTAPGPIYVPEFHRRQLSRVKRMLALSGIDPARCVFMTDIPERVSMRWSDVLLRFGERTPETLNPADYPVPEGPASWAPKLYPLEEEKAERRAWLEARGWLDRPLILVQPGNHRSMSRRRARYRRLNTDTKFWPIENWAELFRRIHARMPGALIVMRGAREELKMLNEIKDAAGLESVVAVPMDLRATFALCAFAHSMIAVDTGPAHAAAALGLPLLVLYGAMSPRVWLPRSASGAPVIGLGGPPVSTRVDQIGVDEVFEAWCALCAAETSVPTGSTPQHVAPPLGDRR